jgi:hypothetical protein
MSNICIVFVCNDKYLDKFIQTCNELITIGKYTGDICLIIGDDLKDQDIEHNVFFIARNNIKVKYFPDIIFPKDFHNVNKKMKLHDNIYADKRFPWHKLHLFSSYFKQWNYILHLDCGMGICNNIDPLIQLFQDNRILAMTDSYPPCNRKLIENFDLRIGYEYFKKLINNFNINVDYFQTSIMMYDTRIIEKKTLNDLYELSVNYPFCKTNDHGIISLYFTNINPVWTVLPLRKRDTYFYENCTRNEGKKKYIVVKNNNW